MPQTTTTTTSSSFSTTTTNNSWNPESNRNKDKGQLAYDEIAMAAIRNGLLTIGSKISTNIINNKLYNKNTKKKFHVWTRPLLRKIVQRYHEDVSNRTVSDLPKVCLKETERNELERISLGYEEKILPSFYDSPYGKPTHQKVFARYQKNGQFCAVDTTQVLQMESWKAFFASR